MDKEATQYRNDVIERLKSAGVTPTQQRVEIAQILFRQPQHMSAEQVLSVVNASSSVVSKATVYNTLGLFAEKGLVREVIVAPAKIFYDSNVSEHHHFFNVDTGELTDIHPTAVRVDAMPSLPQGTVADGVEVIIRLRNHS